MTTPTQPPETISDDEFDKAKAEFEATKTLCFQVHKKLNERRESFIASISDRQSRNSEKFAAAVGRFMRILAQKHAALPHCSMCSGNSRYQKTLKSDLVILSAPGENFVTVGLIDGHAECRLTFDWNSEKAAFCMTPGPLRINGEVSATSAPMRRLFGLDDANATYILKDLPSEFIPQSATASPKPRSKRP